MTHKYKIVIARYGQADEKLTESGWHAGYICKFFKFWVLYYKKWFNPAVALKDKSK